LLHSPPSMPQQHLVRHMAECCSAPLWLLFSLLQIPQKRKLTRFVTCHGLEASEEGPEPRQNVLAPSAQRLQRMGYLCAPFSLAKLVLHNPYMASHTVLAHPGQIITLLKNCEVGKLDLFCAACPAAVMRDALPKLLSVLVPLLNNVEMHAPLAAMLRRVDALRLAEILNGALLGRLDVVMRCPGETVVDILCAVKDARICALLPPVNQAPEKLLDFVSHCASAEKAAAIVNFIEPEAIVWLFYSTSPARLAELLGHFDAAEFRENGCFIRFLGHLQGERRLTNNVVGPFLSLVPPAVVAQMVREVPAEQLLKVLCNVGPRGVARILENTNVDLIIRMWTGRLESLVVNGAAPLSALQRDVRAAAAIKNVSDGIQQALSSYRRLVAVGA